MQGPRRVPGEGLLWGGRCPLAWLGTQATGSGTVGKRPPDNSPAEFGREAVKRRGEGASEAFFLLKKFFKKFKISLIN